MGAYFESIHNLLLGKYSIGTSAELRQRIGKNEEGKLEERLSFGRGNRKSKVKKSSKNRTPLITVEQESTVKPKMKGIGLLVSSSTLNEICYPAQLPFSTTATSLWPARTDGLSFGCFGIFAAFLCTCTWISMLLLLLVCRVFEAAIPQAIGKSS
ncbi:hypothetical protein BT96DRAFT_62923 [Gymnopus androsaceus JB14]|uniref:Uncharacterized protein n=1 Tax=Gymnopus androsaceus JB14 TaxID=1447944 RepID=A0A6A4HJS6_9AGAR|nr:hypothetical protein BT96DRAFT_62923 [Gymnopus androsaceus JB14]